MNASAWFPMLVRNRFAVTVSRIPFALLVSVYAIFNSALASLQSLIFAKRIAETVLEPPVFIIGHWRTGTTWMHELLACDPSFRTPISLECFAPGHALVSGFLLRKLSAILPPVRPADAMQVGWDLPQEDEFALLNLGIGSPYETIFFPNRRPFRHLSMRASAGHWYCAWPGGIRGGRAAGAVDHP